MAHAAEAAHRAGMDDAKLEAVCDYRTSPLYTEAERVALDFAVAACLPAQCCHDDLFARMKRHWTDGQIVEFAGVVALNGFLNAGAIRSRFRSNPSRSSSAKKHLVRHGCAWANTGHSRSAGVYSANRTKT